MNPFEYMGIAVTGDELEIKKAYARKLKSTRPDDDPAGFQTLHEAYQHCLSFARNLAHGQVDQPVAQDEPNHASAQDAAVSPAADQAQSQQPDETNDGPSRARPGQSQSPVPSAPPPSEDRAAPIHFDLDDFLRQLFARAATQSPPRVVSWLRTLEPLYSLKLKHALRGPVARSLAEVEPPPSNETIDAISEFFALVTIDPRERHLRQAVEYAHHRSRSHEDFARIVNRRCSPNTRAAERWQMLELLGPRFWLRRLLIAATPMLPTYLMELLARLEQTDASLAQSRLDAASVEFWRRATDRSRLNYRRLLIGLGRCALYYLITVGFASLLMGLDPAPFARAGQNIAALFAGWLIPVALWAALLQVRAVTERRLGWDTPVVLATPALLACLALGHVFPLEAAFFAGAIAIALIMARGRIHSVPAVAFYVASLTAVGAIASALRLEMDPMLPYIAVAAGALQIGHDLIYARARKISIAQARTRAGWLWALSGVFAIGGIGLLFAAAM